MESSYNLNIHSAEVPPDGNILRCGSVDTGVGAFVVFYQNSKVVQQTKAESTLELSTPYAHGAVYHKGTGLLFARGYFTILVLKYSSGANKRGELKLVDKISLEKYYEEPNHNEDRDDEDGKHDMYPIDGDPNNIFVTTGEHVFILNVKG